ncbi:MAG TPA: cytochrome c [Chitinophagaceae bacterium]|nr:cytochrome c [Chitinophagaceae bacterium]
MFQNRQKVFTLLLLLMGFLSYSFFLYTELPIQTTEVNKDADAGKLIWQKYNCNACHQVYGLGGYLGPDLTNVYSTRGSKYIQAFLKTGTGAMPQFNLTETETSMLLAFLKTTDASGKSDPKTFIRNYDGTIEQ